MDPIVEQSDLPATPPPDIAPAAPEPSDDVEQLLAEFDRANNQGGQQTPVQEDPIADLLRDPADQQRIGELTGELDGLRGEVHRKAELEAFDKFSSELQAKLPEHLPPDYSRNALLAAAAQDQLTLNFVNSSSCTPRCCERQTMVARHRHWLKSKTRAGLSDSC
jgi:hypothetical protein